MSDEKKFKVVGMQVLDMLINLLTEHEKKIDALIDRFEKALEIIEEYHDAHM